MLLARSGLITLLPLMAGTPFASANLGHFSDANVTPGSLNSRLKRVTHSAVSYGPLST